MASPLPPRHCGHRRLKVCKPHERPGVEVLVDGPAHSGELRGTWWRNGAELCNVSWRERAGMTHLDTVTADRVTLICGNAPGPVRRGASPCRRQSRPS